MVANHEAAFRLELDNETAFEVAWGMVSDRVSAAAAELYQHAEGTSEAQEQHARIRRLIDIRDSLSPDRRDALDVVMALVPALSEPTEPARA